MPTAENTEAITGRVTRSRKRLTSIDGESSSRPGTPVNINLQTIPETNTPLKRITRRASLSSTPAPITPSKTKTTLDNVELSNTPGRRPTRRRSVNITSDIEDHASQPIVSKPTISVVKEEEPQLEVEISKDKPTRITRSSSKSPRDNETGSKKNSKQSNKKTNADESLEVINLDDSVEVLPSKANISHSKTPKVSIKREKDETPKKTQTQQIENESTPTKKPLKLSTPRKITSNKQIPVIVEEPPNSDNSNQSSENIKERKRSSGVGFSTPTKSPKPIVSTEQSNSDKGSSKKSESAKNKKLNSKGDDKPEASSSHNDSRKTNQSTILENTSPKNTTDTDVFIDSESDEEANSSKKQLNTSKKNASVQNLITSMKRSSLGGSPKKRQSLEKDIQKSPWKLELSKNSPQKKTNRPEQLKNVAFNDTADESTIKSVYPKTPGLTKSKSYILDSSKDVEQDSSFISKTVQSFEDENAKKSDKDIAVDGEEHEGLSSKTPYKLKLKSGQSSTPIQGSSSPKPNTTSEVEEQNEKPAKDNLQAEEEEEEGVFSFPKTWTQTVSVKVTESTKIDCIAPQKQEMRMAEPQFIDKSGSISSQSSKHKSNRQESDDSEADDDMREEDDEDYLDDDDEDEPIREKTIFLDDEAMEVPEGEESMDSEEREYLEQNEVAHYAESIGSQDSEEDDGYDDDEADEEDAAFIVSDTEVVHEELEDEDIDDLEAKCEKTSKQKIYKRIRKVSESSDEQSNHPPSKDDTDFCLLVDSSLEENKSHGDDVEFPTKTDKNNSAIIKESNEKNMSRKSMANKSIEEKSTKDKSLKESSRLEEDNSDTEVSENEDKPKSASKTAPKKSRRSMSTFQSKADISGSDDDVLYSEDQELRNVLKSPSNKELVNSPKRKSITKPTLDESEDESCQNKSTKASRNSMNENKACNDDVSDTTKSPSKTPANRSRRMSTFQSKAVISESDDDSEDQVLKSPPKKELAKSPKRTSIANTVQNESEDESSQNKSTTASRNSMNKSKACNDDVSDTKMTDSNTKSPSKTPANRSRRMSTFQSKSDISESDDDDSEDQVLKSPPKKELAKSPKRQSIANTVQNESEDESSQNKSTKASRNSMNKSKASDDVSVQEEASNTELAENGGNAKSPTQPPIRARRMSTFQSKPDISESEDNSENQEEEELKSPAKKSPKRKSICNPAQEKSEDESSQNKSTKDSRKSIKRKSLARTSTEETEESKESPRKLNTSRKSLVRTSTEDAEDTEEQNKTIMSVESESEPEEEEEPFPLSATPKDASPGRTLNSSKKMKKSLGQEQEEQSNDKPAKPQRRESIAQEVIINENVSESSDLEDEEEGDDKTSAEITDDEMETSRNEANEAQFSDQEENVATDETMQDFLGEGDKPSKANSSRRKSVAVANESKLDETFQMDPKNSLSSSMHDSLHRSILRKSLNQSQLRREAIEANRNNIDEEGNASSSDSEEGESSEEEEVQINKKVVCEKGLSVSLNSIQIKKKKLKDAKAIRNSFTIGVSVRKNSSEDADSSCVRNFEETLSQNEVHSENEEASPSSSSSSATESEQPILSEEEDLEKVKDVQRVGPYNKSRKSMSSSFLQAPPQPPSDSDANQQKRIKRTSLYLQEEVASNSFVENLAEEKKKIKQQKRKSSSFCGVTAPADDEDAIHVSEPRSEKKLKKTSEESEEKEDKDNIHHILSRCDEIMEKANQAKREAKLNAKKVKVKKPKWEKKEEEAPPKADDEVKIPLVSKKEIKRKEKLKKELAKAVKQSVAVLTKIVQPTTKADQKNVPEKPETNKISSSKRLETEFLESLVELSHPKKKKAKEMDTTPPSDKENSKKKSNKSKSKQTFEDVHEKPKPKIQTLETVCGTVIVEPSTPKKLRNQNGFRESPKTPVGFKIQDISSANNAKAAASQKSQKLAARKLLTASGSFVEEDLSSKPSNSKRKTRKRKLPKIDEPIYSLPKTQWTPSGVFVEEDLFSARPLANSTATQFLVTSLNNGKTNKSTSKVVSSTTLNSALSFKQNALRSSKVPRQDSREILHRKQRKAINKQF